MPVRAQPIHPKGSPESCVLQGRRQSRLSPPRGRRLEKRETKVAFGEKREYLVLRLAYGDLILNVPADNTEGVGLREVINDEEVEEVFAVLRKKEARMPTNWSRRYKNHSEKLRSGDIDQVAEVVRNLSIRDKDKGLSAGRSACCSGPARSWSPSSPSPSTWTRRQPKSA